MPSYRVYWLDKQHHIRRGAWIEASDDEDARAQASHLCDEHSDAIEVWQADRPVDEIDCPDEPHKAA